MIRRATLVGLLLIVNTASAQTNWCVWDPVPDNKCGSFGDPASISGDYSHYSVDDISIDTPAGPFKLTRGFFASTVAWNRFLGLRALPRPFSGPGVNVEWWHSLYSMAYVNNSELFYASGKNGNEHVFQNLDPAACQPPNACYWQRFKTSGYQARSTTAGYGFVQPDLSEHFHEAKFFDSSYMNYLLTKIVTAQGATLATISYAAPAGLTNCPGATPPAGEVPPYISVVTLAGGHQLKFNYWKPSGSPCVLRAIDYLAPGSNTPTQLVKYDLATSPAGRVSAVTFRDAGVESYDYFNDTGFAVVRGTGNVFQHQFVSGTDRHASVLSGSGNAPSVTVLSYVPPTLGNVFPLTTTGASCIATSGNVEVINLSTSVAGTAGDSTNAVTAMTTNYQAIRNDTYGGGASAHTRFRLRDTDSCAVAEACSAGENRYEPRPIPSVEGVSGCPQSEWTVAATKNKRANWTLTPSINIPFLLPDGGSNDGGSNSKAPQSIQRGMYEDAGSLVAPLETESYTYLVKTGGHYAVETKTHPGGLSASVVTTYSYTDVDAGLRLDREVTTGLTYISGLSSGWTTGTRHRATFYRAATDQFQRPYLIEGPCWVSSPSANACDTALNEVSSNPATGSWPFTWFDYYGPTSDTNSQRLLRIKRYPDVVANSAPLITEFSNYTPEGDPGKVSDVSNGVDTDFTYIGRKPVSQRVYSIATPGTFAETLWYWDEDQLTAVRYPEGNFEVLCYRTSAFPNCTGVLSRKLQWRAKTDALTGFTGTTGWSERIEYSYTAGGYQLEERRYVVGDANPRLKKRTHPDLHGRTTYSRTGGAADGGEFFSTAHFDGADNRDAVGPAANLPPDYCRTAGANSPLCWWFRYDRAERLNRADAPNGLSRSCFDYDVAGNVIGVATGGAGLNCDTSYNLPGQATALTADATRIAYSWDDFGQLIGVCNGGTQTGCTQYRYDAQGNVREKEVVGTALRQSLKYDGLGRLIQVSDESTPTLLYQFDYDVSSVASPSWMAARTFTSGRLARRLDSFGSTWYSYNYQGNTIAEYRDRSGCDFATRGTHCRPHTTYAWDRNGNLTSIVYPYGRTVTQVYGSGALRDRLSSIQSTVWLTGGTTTTRTLANSIRWEPYGGLRGYTAFLNNSAIKRGVEYFLGPAAETDPGTCSSTYSGPSDGSGRVRGLFVGNGTFSPNPIGHIAPTVFSQRYRWNEDQVARNLTCLGTTQYIQDFSYDSMQRLTSEVMNNVPRILNDAPSETKTFDVRSNRNGGTRDGYGVLDETFDPIKKDQLREVCWWRGFLAPNECFIGNRYALSAQAGAVESIEGIKGSGSAWWYNFDYDIQPGLSDVFRTVDIVGSGAGATWNMLYDAFNRRRAKYSPLGAGTEFTYDLGHQLLVESQWPSSPAASTIDEYLWLDGRPLATFRSNVTATGSHANDYVQAQDTTKLCSRPSDEGAVHCGLFHHVSNLQGFVNVTMHDFSGKVASFMLPDADGTVNQPRMNSFGGLGTALTMEFNVPTTFSKQARFRTSWTGPIYGYAGVSSFQLNGTTVLSPKGAEIGQAWSAWGPAVTGTSNVTWSTTCGGACGSAVDLFEWRVYETGAAQFQTRLRFPGQYHDVETDLYENWNRYYEHSTGRYLSPEPLLQRPSFSSRLRLSGRSLPNYTYALGNPSAFVDSTGLAPNWAMRRFAYWTMKTVMDLSHPHRFGRTATPIDEVSRKVKEDNEKKKKAEKKKNGCGGGDPGPGPNTEGGGAEDSPPAPSPSLDDDSSKKDLAPYCDEWGCAVPGSPPPIFTPMPWPGAMPAPSPVPVGNPVLAW